jgi:hypothetical protein
VRAEVRAMDEKAEAAKRFSEFLEGQPNALLKALIVELGPDRVERFGNALEHFLRPLIETAKQIDSSPIWDGRWTRHNIIRAAEEALEDTSMSAGRAESIRQRQALFIEGFDRFADDKALSTATRAAALMAIGAALLIGAESPDGEAVRAAQAEFEADRRARQAKAVVAGQKSGASRRAKAANTWQARVTEEALRLRAQKPHISQTELATEIVFYLGKEALPSHPIIVRYISELERDGALRRRTK